MNSFLKILSFLFLSFYFSLAQNYPENRVKLSDVQTLTLSKNALTTHRRLDAVQQLSCEGGTAGCKITPNIVQCYNRGFDGIRYQWECKAELPKSIIFGKIAVSCEGYDNARDEYVLAGSCALKYTLETNPDPSSHVGGGGSGGSGSNTNFGGGIFSGGNKPNIGGGGGLFGGGSGSGSNNNYGGNNNNYGSNSSSGKSSKGKSFLGTILGIVIGVVLLLICIAICICCLCTTACSGIINKFKGGSGGSSNPKPNVVYHPAPTGPTINNNPAPYYPPPTYNTDGYSSNTGGNSGNTGGNTAAGTHESSGFGTTENR